MNLRANVLIEGANGKLEEWFGWTSIEVEQSLDRIARSLRIDELL